MFVATHEHWDHVSGLHHARSVFDELVIDEVWLAWTEDPRDPLAKRLAEKHAQALQALSAVSARLTAMKDPQAAALAEVLSFHGGLEAASGMRRAAQAIAYIRDEKEASPRAISVQASQPLRLPDVPGIQIYVLGPPRNEPLLSRSNPSKKHSEVYETAMSLSEPTAFYAAVLAAAKAEAALSAEQAEIFERSQPFEKHRGISMKDAEADPFFCARYGFGANDEGPRGGASSQTGWRWPKSWLCILMVTPTTRVWCWPSRLRATKACCCSQPTPRWATGSLGTM